MTFVEFNVPALCPHDEGNLDSNSQIWCSLHPGIHDLSVKRPLCDGVHQSALSDYCMISHEERLLCTAETSSPRKALNSSPWARHFHSPLYSMTSGDSLIPVWNSVAQHVLIPARRIRCMSEQKQSARGSRRGAFAQSIVGAAGALLYSTMSLVWPKPHPRSVLDPGPGRVPGIVGWSFRLSHLLGNYYVQLAIFAVFVLLAVFRRKQRGAWIFAFLSGWAFPELFIFHWIR